MFAVSASATQVLPISAFQYDSISLFTLRDPGFSASARK